MEKVQPDLPLRSPRIVERDFRFWVTVIMLSSLPFIGVGFLAYATTNGIGISPDSVNYLGTARNVLGGAGFTTYTGDPLIHFPPSFPAAIAAISFIGFDVIDAATLLNMLLIGATIASIMLIVYLETKGDFTATALAGVLITTSIPILYVHSWAWSEPLFIFLSIWGLYLLTLSLTCRSALIFSGLCIGLACITRYAGIALIVTGVISILLMQKAKIWLRIRLALAWGCVSAFFLVAWMLRNMYIGESAANRSIVYHPIPLSKVKGGTATVLQWILPGERSVVIIGFLAVTALIFWFYTFRRSSVLVFAPIFSLFVSLLGIYLIIYPLFLLVSISFIDAGTPLDSRILSPLFPALVIISAKSFAQLKRSVSMTRLEQGFIGLAIFLFIALHGATSANWLVERHADGIGYNAFSWRKSQTIAFLQRLPKDSKVFSNAQDAVYILTERHSLPIPAKWYSGSLEPNADYASELHLMSEELENNNVLVMFDLVTWRDYLPTEGELLAELPLTLLVETDDGAIYTVK